MLTNSEVIRTRRNCLEDSLSIVFAPAKKVVGMPCPRARDGPVPSSDVLRPHALQSLRLGTVRLARCQGTSGPYGLAGPVVEWRLLILRSPCGIRAAVPHDHGCSILLLSADLPGHFRRASRLRRLRAIWF